MADGLCINRPGAHYFTVKPGNPLPDPTPAGAQVLNAILEKAKTAQEALVKLGVEAFDIRYTDCKFMPNIVISRPGFSNLQALRTLLVKEFKGVTPNISVEIDGKQFIVPLDVTSKWNLPTPRPPPGYVKADDRFQDVAT